MFSVHMCTTYYVLCSSSLTSDLSQELFRPAMPALERVGAVGWPPRASVCSELSETACTTLPVTSVWVSFTRIVTKVASFVFIPAEKRNTVYYSPHAR